MKIGESILYVILNNYAFIQYFYPTLFFFLNSIEMCEIVKVLM